MPPRKGIVASGNAGNSSKSKAVEKPVPDGEKPLFPPGSKTPLSLLHERCQKNGWEKPDVNVRQQGKQWSFSITLSRVNKKSSEKETVHMAPHPPYLRPTALEARHWGATYALYRFCNGIQLNRVLPQGPRDYWLELVDEQKAAPSHLSWMYDSDPFAARKAVEERQAKASQKHAQIEESAVTTSPKNNSVVSGPFAQAPEVRMAPSLREYTEEAIKKGISLYPEAEDAIPSVISEHDASSVSQKLSTLGFNRSQIKAATDFLSSPSALATNLLRALPALQACIEYLILHVPECDLPARFLPDSNSSNPLISSLHSGMDDLSRRWIEDRAIKEAGWPPIVVKACLSDSRLVQNWDLLIGALGKRLCGQGLDDIFNDPEPSLAYNLDPEEYEALGGSLQDPSHLLMPMFSAPLTLHILISSESHYPRPRFSPLYLTSPSVAAYIRLHLLSKLLEQIDNDALLEPGEGFCMAAMRILETEWAAIEDNGPPNMSSVMQNLVPSLSEKSNSIVAIPELDEPTSARPQRIKRVHRGDDRTDEQIGRDFEGRLQNPKYLEMLDYRKKLPAFSMRDEFLKQLSTNQVLVVVGETVPQFILDALISSNKGAKASILITQPRRLSAIGVAARVSSERLEDGSVGYAIRGESKQDKRTKLLFCTTGIVLRRLSSGDTLEDVTHVVVDEVHERTVDGDILLLELKELLQKRPNLKVILMSATINHEIFMGYFNGAPLLSIPGITYPVTDLYLEDVVPKIHYRPSFNKFLQKENEDASKGFTKEMKNKGLADEDIMAIRSISRAERIDYQLIAAVVQHLISTSTKPSGVLIFLPGVQEIRQCIEAIHGVFKQDQGVVLPLHANLSNDEQLRIFAKTNKWKIIAATNVAETSITIDDVVFVIDAGKVKEMIHDPQTRMSRLTETWVTQAAARQRRGRAGRTQPGFCYKLYTRMQENNMAKFPIPEILRIPLESVSLSVKATRENEDVKLFLTRAINPPDLSAMETAWSVLQELGAIDSDGNMTALGKHMSMLPVDLRLGKMLILGAIFRCLDPILTIVACLSSKPLFTSPIDKRDEATQARARFATSESDLLTDLEAYGQCMNMRTEGKSQGAVRQFCENNFISAATVREISTLRYDFLSLLKDMNFVQPSSSPSSMAHNINSKNSNLLKSVILGGLYPRIAKVHLPKSAIKFDKVQAGAIQRENTAKEFKFYDISSDERVFLHPSSVLFSESSWRCRFVVYFQKHMTSKIFLRDVTQVPLYSLLLFGGAVTVNHIAGGLEVGTGSSMIKLRAWPRIGILVNQLRRLLDAQLSRCLDEGRLLEWQDNTVLQAMLALITHDGASEDL
ncbi:P-loop containing nucleoside triphosphate hydrolase protein [Mycena floridula]|nr:P-loop containing nucleoside triphosphate hydrolase protein [Mycena floridula]